MSAEPKLAATIPELEANLIEAAARRFAPKSSRRRFGAPLVLFAALALTGGALAATGVFSGGAEIERGATASGPYAIRIKPSSPGAQTGPVCLQLQWEGLRPSYKCGYPPSSKRPFGLVSANFTPVPGGPEVVSERVIYGLVSDEIERVVVLGSVVGQEGTGTVAREGLPGRYFSIVVPNEGNIELVGYDAEGEEVGRAGSLTEPARRVEEGLIPAPGDPAVFAPTATPASTVVYRGRTLTWRHAQALNLVCVETGGVVPCYDSIAEANTAFAEGFLER